MNRFVGDHSGAKWVEVDQGEPQRESAASDDLRGPIGPPARATRTERPRS